MTTVCGPMLAVTGLMYRSAKPLYTVYTRNSSGDEIANVNFLYDDIIHALKIQQTLA